ncbi:MAG: helix-turn-helix domain-containing protein [Acidobacteriota bacterium]
MSSERISAIDSSCGSTSKHREPLEPFEPFEPRPSETFSVPQPRRLRLTHGPLRNRVQRLLQLADSLLKETDSLARDKEFADESNRLQTLSLSEGIDFYDEVKRFETGLIRLALDQTRGHQAQAAKLLRIKPTTLNSKIKLYGIDCQS